MSRHPNIPLSDFFVLNRTIKFIHRHTPLLIIIVGLMIRIPFLFVPEINGFQHTSWRQTDTASIAHNFVDNEFNLFYPQIHWGGNGPGYVETEFQLYPFLVAQLYNIFGEQVWLGMLVSLLFTLGTFIVFYALAQSLVSRSAAIIALLFFVCVPINLSYSVVFMPEPTVYFFYIVALYLFHKWINEQHFRWILLGAICTALAILVKPTTVHIGFIFLLMLLQKFRRRTFTKWQVWLFAIISLLPGILWYLHARNLYLDYGNTFGIISGGDSKFNNLQYWLSPSFYSSVASIELKWVFALGGIIPFAIGMILTWLKRQPMLIIFGMVAQVLYYLIIPRYISFAIYYHIFAVPFVSLAVGLGFVWLFDNRRDYVQLTRIRIPSRAIYTGASLIALVTLATTAKFYRDNLLPSTEPFWNCSQYVSSLVPEDERIIVSTSQLSYDKGVPNNYEEPNLFYYSHRYGWSLPADQHTSDEVHRLHELGAEYLVVVDHDPLHESQDLLAELSDDSAQIGPGTADQCSIYRFEHVH